MAKTKPKTPKTIGIRKTIDLLVNKVEALENQSFIQKVAIDELENKLQQAEILIKQIQEDPFNIQNAPYVTTPFVQSAPPVAPLILPQITYTHVCVGGAPDWTGTVHCTSCGVHMSGPQWTVTSTSDKTTLFLSDPTSQSSTGVEDILEFDVIIDD